MTEDYTIVQLDQPDDAAWKAVGGGIRDFNNSHAGEHGHRNICFLLRAEDGEIAGGLIGETYWNWLYVNLLFVREELRGHGYGERLLARAEQEARQYGATDSLPSTPSVSRRPGFTRNSVTKPSAPWRTFLPDTGDILCRRNCRDGRVKLMTSA